MANNIPVDILPVEDNPTGAEPALRTLTKHNLTNPVGLVNNVAAPGLYWMQFNKVMPKCAATR